MHLSLVSTNSQHWAAGGQCDKHKIIAAQAAVGSAGWANFWDSLRAQVLALWQQGSESLLMPALQHRTAVTLKQGLA